MSLGEERICISIKKTLGQSFQHIPTFGYETGWILSLTNDLENDTHRLVGTMDYY